MRRSGLPPGSAEQPAEAVPQAIRLWFGAPRATPLGLQLAGLTRDLVAERVHLRRERPARPKERAGVPAARPSTTVRAPIAGHAALLRDIPCCLPGPAPSHDHACAARSGPGPPIFVSGRTDPVGASMTNASGARPCDRSTSSTTGGG